MYNIHMFTQPAIDDIIKTCGLFRGMAGFRTFLLELRMRPL